MYMIPGAIFAVGRGTCDMCWIGVTRICGWRRTMPANDAWSAIVRFLLILRSATLSGKSCSTTTASRVNTEPAVGKRCSGHSLQAITTPFPADQALLLSLSAYPTPSTKRPALQSAFRTTTSGVRLIQEQDASDEDCVTAFPIFEQRSVVHSSHLEGP